MLWFLRNIKNNNVLYIKENCPTVVGRSNCDFIIPDDQSISRKHATIRVVAGIVTLADHNSRYGTYVNENIATQTKVDPEVNIVVKENDLIKFGLLQSDWTLQKHDFVTCHSTCKLKGGEMGEQLKELGVAVSNVWSAQCTHLTMPEITLTMKVVLALSYLRPIVKPEYWKQCYQSYVDNVPMPDAIDFLPEGKEPSINRLCVNYHADEKRTTLFQNKKFVFFTQQQLNSYGELVRRSQGECVLLDVNKPSEALLASPNTVFIMQSNRTSESCTEQGVSQVSDTLNILKGKNLRVVPETEICQAILYISIEKYCNPSFNFASVIVDSEGKSEAQWQKRKENALVLAPETQDMTQWQHPNVRSSTSTKINETLESTSSGKESFVIPTPPSIISTPSNSVPSITTQDSGTKAKFSRSISPSFEEPPRKKVSNVFSCGVASSSSMNAQDSLFNFVADKVETPKRKESCGDNQLSIQPRKVRKVTTSTVDDGDLFKFSIDDKEASTSKKTAGQLKLAIKNKEASELRVKRKHVDEDNVDSKRFNLEASTNNGTNNSHRKIDFRQSVWKSCHDFSSMKPIKQEKDLAKVDGGVNFDDADKVNGESLKAAIVIVDDSLIKREASNLAEVTKHMDNLRVGVNFKKFVKSQPVRTPKEVFQKNDFSVFESFPRNAVEVESSSEQEDEESNFMVDFIRGSGTLTNKSMRKTRRL